MTFVPTPARDGKADVSYVLNALESVKGALEDDALVVIESTVPTGFVGVDVRKSLESVGKRFLLAYSAERALPGDTLREMVHNDRVIGGMDALSRDRAHALYSTFVKGSIWLTDLPTAEMVKLMENTYRDVNIALANEFAMIAEDSGVDVWTAIEMANRNPRVDIHRPGPGVGGHCIPIDPLFLAQISGNSRLVRTAHAINDSMPERVVERVKRITEGDRSVTVSALGLAYKKGVSDIRESPAIRVVELLKEDRFRVKTYDPYVALPDSSPSLDACVRESDCLLLLTDHAEFAKIDPETLAGLGRKRILDTRNIIDVNRWRRAGFEAYIWGNGRLMRDLGGPA